MIYAYQIKPNLYLGDVIGFQYDDGIPLGYTRTAPPMIPKGQFARWGLNGWEITKEPPPPEPEPLEELRIISKLAFLDRLTEDEHIAMLTLSKTNVIAEAWFQKFHLMGNVVLNDLRLGVFLDNDVLTLERADQILKSPVQDHERPN